MINFILQEQAAALRISGADANTYLQGQFTNDLSGPTGSSVYGLWLNQKGRIFADSTILRTGPNEWRVFSASVSGAALMQRLNDYIIADEVEVADESPLWQSIIFWREGADAADAVPGFAPLVRGQFRHLDAGFVFGSREPAPGALWLATPADAFDAAVEKLRAVHAREAAAEHFTRERLRHRRPSVPQDLGPADFPQEGGLEVEAVSFTKGCFLGQEVMARLKNRGQLRRRLEVLRGTGAPPAPGTALFQGGKKIGETRSSATDGDGFLCFAMITLAGWNPAHPAALAPDGAETIRCARP